MAIAYKTLAALALLSTATLSQVADPKSPTSGTWATDFGTIKLMEDAQGNISGSYVTDNGRITGKIENGVIDGFWVESASDYTCDIAKLGSRHWGRIRFELNSDRTGWTGIWSYCDYEYIEGNVWNGKRTAK